MTILSTVLRTLSGAFVGLTLAHGLASQKELRILCEIPFYDVSQLLDAGAVSADGSVIVQGGTSIHGTDVYIQIWDRKTGLRRRTIAVNKVVALALAPDGKIVAGSDGGHRIRTWNCKSGKKTRSLAGHKGAVVSLAFSPDGSKIASSAEDNTVRIWHAARGTLLGTLPRPSPCLRLVFSPDSKSLAGCEKNGTVTVWRVGARKSIACFPLPRTPGATSRGKSFTSMAALRPASERATLVLREN